MATFPLRFPFTFTTTPAPLPEQPPPDTDRYIYRYVTKYRNGEIMSELTQIAITQP